jgi:hypothetical protein
LIPGPSKDDKGKSSSNLNLSSQLANKTRCHQNDPLPIKKISAALKTLMESKLLANDGPSSSTNSREKVI